MKNNNFTCKQCGTTRPIAEDADLDFESCADCGVTGEWKMVKKTTTAVARTEELLPAIVAKITAKQLFADEQIKEVVLWVKGEAAKHEDDTTTDKGRKAIASNAAKVSGSKVALEKIAAARKRAMKAETEQEFNVIQTGLKYAIAELETLRDEKRQPLTDWEKAEEERKASEALAAELELAHTEALAEDDLFNRQKDVEEKLAKIKAAEDKAEADKAEAERLEQERIAKEQAAKDEQEKTAKLKAEAEEAARIAAQIKIDEAEAAAVKAENEKKEQAEKAELEKKQAAEQAEEDKRAAVKEAEEKAAKKEAARLVEEEKARNKEEKRQANKKHRAKIDKEVVKAIMSVGSIAEGQVKALVESIGNDDFTLLKILY